MSRNVVRIEVPITEADTHDFQSMINADSYTITWNFVADDGTLVSVELMTDEELERREEDA